MSATSVANETSAKSSEQPTMAFLEFLADLKEVDGEWVSAMDIDESGSEAELTAEATDANASVEDKQETSEKQKEDGQ